MFIYKTHKIFIYAHIHAHTPNTMLVPIAVWMCILLINPDVSPKNLPTVFSIDGQKFAILKSPEHFQYLPCIENGTHIVFFDETGAYEHELPQLIATYSTDWSWKYISDEEMMYEWFQHIIVYYTEDNQAYSHTPLPPG